MFDSGEKGVYNMVYLFGEGGNDDGYCSLS